MIFTGAVILLSPVTRSSIITHPAADVLQMWPLLPLIGMKVFFQPGVQTRWDAVAAHWSPEPLAAPAWPPHPSPGTAPSPQPPWQLLGRVTLSRPLPAPALVMAGALCAGESPRSGTAARAQPATFPTRARAPGPRWLSPLFSLSYWKTLRPKNYFPK